MGLGEQLLVQAAIGIYKAQRRSKLKILISIFCLLLSLVGTGFLIVAGYGFLKTIYAPPEAAALTAGAILGVIVVLSLVIVIINTMQKSLLGQAEEKFIRAAAGLGGATMKELEQPIKDNPRLALLLAAMAGLMIGRKI